jgi:hypothetical protein
VLLEIRPAGFDVIHVAFAIDTVPDAVTGKSVNDMLVATFVVLFNTLAATMGTLPDVLNMQVIALVLSMMLSRTAPAATETDTVVEFARPEMGTVKTLPAILGLPSVQPEAVIFVRSATEATPFTLFNGNVMNVVVVGTREPLVELCPTENVVAVANVQLVVDVFVVLRFLTAPDPIVNV